MMPFGKTQGQSIQQEPVKSCEALLAFLAWCWALGLSLEPEAKNASDWSLKGG